MRKYLILIVTLLIVNYSFSQTRGYLKYDSVYLSQDGKSTELILNNSTKDINGFLFNIGKGRTKFLKPVSKVGFNYLIGQDTLYMLWARDRYKTSNSKNILFPVNLNDTVVFGTTTSANLSRRYNFYGTSLFNDSLRINGNLLVNNGTIDVIGNPYSINAYGRITATSDGDDFAVKGSGNFYKNTKPIAKGIWGDAYLANDIFTENKTLAGVYGSITAYNTKHPPSNTLMAGVIGSIDQSMTNDTTYGVIGRFVGASNGGNHTFYNFRAQNAFANTQNKEVGGLLIDSVPNSYLDNALVGEQIPFGVRQKGNNTRNVFNGTVLVGKGNKNSGSAQLQVNSTNKGFLPPTLTTSERNTIGSIKTISVIDGGLGYLKAPKVIVSNPNTGGTVATATANITGGAVTSIDIKNEGVGYGGLTPTISFDNTGTNGSGAIATATVSIDRGIMIFNTTDTVYQFYNGNEWVNIGSGEGGGTGSGTVIDGNGFVKANGTSVYYDNSIYEPAFAKYSAFNKSFGDQAGEITEGNDTRVLQGAEAYTWGDHRLHKHGIANETGTKQFDFSEDENIKFEGQGNTVVSFDAANKKIIFSSTSGTGADGNNYSTSVTAEDGTISIARSGLTAITGTASGNWNINAATVTNGVYTNSVYDNPSFINSLHWNKITNAPSFLTSNQQITFTASGDITGTSVSATNLTPSLSIGNGKVTLAKMANVTGGSIMYRKTAGTGAWEVQSLATLKADLNIPNAYSLPVATETVLGGIKIGGGLYVDGNGKLNASACLPQWGDFNGDIANQLDLINLLNNKESILPSIAGGYYLGQDKTARPLTDVLSAINVNYPLSIDDSVNNSISILSKNIGNTDTVGIYGGTYFYNGSTTGVKPPASSSGQITLLVSSPSNYHNGSNNATMIFYDKTNSGVFLRRFDGTSHTWGGFDTLLNIALGNMNFINLKTGGTFTTDKASIGFPNYSGSFPQPSTSNGVIVGANGGMFTIATNTSKVMFDQSAVTATRQFSLPNKSGEITVAGNTFNTASNLVQLGSDGKLPALDGSKLINLPSSGSTSDSTKLPLLNGGEIRGSNAKIVFHNNTNAYTPVTGKNALMFQNNNFVIGHQSGTVTMMAGNTSGNQVWVTDNNGGGSLVVVPTVLANGYLKRNSTNTEWITEVNNFGAGESSYEDIPETTLDLSSATQTGTTAAPELTGIYEGYKIAGNWVQVDFLITASGQGTDVTELTFPFPSSLPTPKIPSTLTGSNKIIKFAEIGAASTGVNSEPLVNSRAYLVRNSTDNGFLVKIKSNAGDAAVWRVSLKYKIQTQVQ